MKKSLLALLIIAPLSMSLTGCVIAVGGEDGHSMSGDFDDREFKNRKKIAVFFYFLASIGARLQPSPTPPHLMGRCETSSGRS